MAIIKMLTKLLLVIKIVWEITKAAYRYVVPKSKKSIKGEVVMITGTGQGIGRETALVYASEGATVVCVDVNEITNQATVKLIASLGYERAYAYTCDVSNYENVIELTQRIEKYVGNVTILINNAGTHTMNDFCNLSEAEIKQMVDVNVKSHFWTIKAILPSMLKRNYGHIVAIGSVGSFIPVPYLIPYSASKYAVQGLMDGLQNELSLKPKCKIKTTLIHPCIIDTALTRDANVKFSSSLPIFNPKDVAKCIIECQRKNVVEASVPAGYYLTMRIMLRLCPAGAMRLFCKYFKISLRDQPESKIQ